MKKNILITGTSSGIGKAIAEHLTDKGHKVIGTSRKKEVFNPKFETLTLDVTIDKSVEEASLKAIEKLTKIDVLINNAGYGVFGPIEKTSMDEAKQQFETNYFGVLRMINAVIPHMKKNGGGLIINISSMGGLIGLPFQGHYSASKFALEGLLEALRLELSPFNITVVNINPGDFKTSFTANRKQISAVSSDYHEKTEQFLKLYESDEENGSDPIIISKLLEQLISKDKGFKVRYVVGKSSQTMGVALKRILGNNLFEKLMRKIWKV
jgi:short-subunit dehydrogenase